MYKVDFKKSKAALTTNTIDVVDLEKRTNNIYQSLYVLSRRSAQINDQLLEELSAKLAEFATQGDNLEEIFENREQIEISRFYERLPKPHAIALREFLDDEIYFREPDTDEENGSGEPSSEH